MIRQAAQLAEQAVLRCMLGVVHAYRLLLKAWLGAACRFEPTCSAYTLHALHTHGPWRGGALSAKRLMRCGPWCQGGHDPVPSARPPTLFSSLWAAPEPAANQPPSPESVLPNRPAQHTLVNDTP